MRWNIDVAHSARVVKTSAEQAEDYDTALKDLESIGERVQSVVSKSPPVVAALAEFYSEVVLPDMEAVVNRTGSAVGNTSWALQHYVDGDLEMAAESQRAATTAVVPESLPGGGGR